MKYKVTKKFGKYKVGQVVDDKDIYIRRKVQEGGCLEPYEVKTLKKMQKAEYENKAIESSAENKSVENKSDDKKKGVEK